MLPLTSTRHTERCSRKDIAPSQKHTPGQVRSAGCEEVLAIPSNKPATDVTRTDNYRCGVSAGLRFLCALEASLSHMDFEACQNDHMWSKSSNFRTHRRRHSLEMVVRLRPVVARYPNLHGGEILTGYISWSPSLDTCTVVLICRVSSPLVQAQSQSRKSHTRPYSRHPPPFT